jgi:hypothetical protein
VHHCARFPTQSPNEIVGYEGVPVPSSSICHRVAFGWQTASLTEYLYSSTSNGPIPVSLQEGMVVIWRILALCVVLSSAYYSVLESLIIVFILF